MVNSHQKDDRSSNESARSEVRMPKPAPPSSEEVCMPRDVLTNAELYLEFTDRVLGRSGLPRSESKPKRA